MSARRKAPEPAVVRPLWPALVALAVPVVLFARAVGFGFVSWDDQIHVYQNPNFNPVTLPHVLAFWKAPHEALYIPVTYTLWAVQALLAGDRSALGFDPALFHAVNVALHAGNALLVFLVLRRLVRDPLACLAGALLFAVHPLQVESVAWVSEFKGLSAGFFSLLCAWQYLACRQSASRAGARLAVCAAAYALAVLSKPSALVVPLLLVLLDAPWRRRPLRSVLGQFAPWAAAMAAAAFVAVRSQPQSLLRDPAPLWARPLVAADALAFYGAKLFAPSSLGIDYGRTPAAVLASGAAWWTWLGPAAAAACCWLLRKRAPFLGPSLLLSAAALLPVSGLLPFAFQNYSTVADRYAYLAMLGPALVLAHLLDGRPRRVLALPGAGLALLAGLAAGQTGVWRDNLALYRHALAVHPGSRTAHHNLGQQLMAEGRLDEAVDHFRAALRLAPDYVEAHCNLGNALAGQQRAAEALECYRRAVALDPRYVPAYNNWGSALCALGRNEEAARVLGKAIALGPDYPDAYYNLGNALRGTGRLREAIARYDEAIARSPTYVEARINRAISLAELGDGEGARRGFDDAVRFAPWSALAYATRATYAFQTGDTAASRRDYEKALALEPGRVEAAYNLGLLCENEGDRSGAAALYGRVLELAPGHAAAREALGRVGAAPRTGP